MFDIGVNLTSHQFDKDRKEVVIRAQQAGVSGLLVTGSTMANSVQAASLMQEYAGYCWSTVGIHPHDAHSWNDTLAEQILTLAKQEGVVAVGECGLDFKHNFSTPQQQQRAFTAQLALAAECGLPLFLHCREAHDTFIRLLKPWKDKISTGVLHCFTGTQCELMETLKLGLSIGITGWVCDERRGLEVRALLPLIPLDKLLLETDAPYLLPRDLLDNPKTKRNEPCFLPHIVQRVAQWRGEEPQWLGEQTDLNARHLFRI